jgi:predicted HTH domain antitoxin
MPTRLHLEFEVPDARSPRAKTALERQLRAETVVGLFTRRLCSGGFAATLLALTLRECLVLLRDHNVPYSRGSKAATLADRQALDRWRQQRKQRSSAP